MAPNGKVATAAGLGLTAWAAGSAFTAPRAGTGAAEVSRPTASAVEHTSTPAASATEAPVATPRLAVLGAGAAAALLGKVALAKGSSAISAKRSEKRVVSVAAFESELGVQAPVGFWDPLGFTDDGDVENFNRRRHTEIKHGRVSMLATMGYITPELTGKFPGYLSPSTGLKFEDVPNGLAAISKVPTAGWLQILAYGFFCEYSVGLDQSQIKGGDMGFKPPLLTSSDPEQRNKRLNAEIANGRLAMMAIIGMFFQDGLTGSAWGDWALYTDSPLR